MPSYFHNSLRSHSMKCSEGNRCHLAGTQSPFPLEVHVLGFQLHLNVAVIKKYMGKFKHTTLCIPPCAFYFLTLWTGIPLLRACWLSSQRDTERGQSEQRSFCTKWMWPWDVWEQHGLGNITKLLFKSNFPPGWKSCPYNRPNWPKVR